MRGHYYDNHYTDEDDELKEVKQLIGTFDNRILTKF